MPVKDAARTRPPRATRPARAPPPGARASSASPGRSAAAARTARRARRTRCPRPRAPPARSALAGAGETRLQVGRRLDPLHRAARDDVARALRRIGDHRHRPFVRHAGLEPDAALGQAERLDAGAFARDHRLDDRARIARIDHHQLDARGGRAGEVPEERRTLRHGEREVIGREHRDHRQRLGKRLAGCRRPGAARDRSRAGVYCTASPCARAGTGNDHRDRERECEQEPRVHA